MPSAVIAGAAANGPRRRPVPRRRRSSPRAGSFQPSRTVAGPSGVSMARTIAPGPSHVVGSPRPVRYQARLSRIARCCSSSSGGLSVRVIVADRISEGLSRSRGDGRRRSGRRLAPTAASVGSTSAQMLVARGHRGAKRHPLGSASLANTAEGGSPVAGGVGGTAGSGTGIESISTLGVGVRRARRRAARWPPPRRACRGTSRRPDR